MKKAILLATLGLVLFSCKKDVDPPAPAPTPVVDNGPIGGTYAFSSTVTKSYDTIPGSGILTINEYTTTAVNLKGTMTVTASSITSKGLMYDYTTTGTTKEVNTATGATGIINRTPLTGASGQSTTSVAKGYTISTATGELTIDDAQYLFNPAFVTQPAGKKHKYSLSGTTLKITTEQYDAAARYRVVNEATFTKQ